MNTTIHTSPATPLLLRDAVESGSVVAERGATLHRFVMGGFAAYIMTSSQTGIHTLNASVTDADRLWAHWRGFVERQEDVSAERDRMKRALVVCDAELAALRAKVDGMCDVVALLADETGEDVESFDRKLAIAAAEKWAANLRDSEVLELLREREWTVDVTVRFSVDARNAEEAREMARENIAAAVNQMDGDADYFDLDVEEAN